MPLPTLFNPNARSPLPSIWKMHAGIYHSAGGTALPSPGHPDFVATAPHSLRGMEAVHRSMRNGTFGQDNDISVIPQLTHRRSYWAETCAEPSSFEPPAAANYFYLNPRHRFGRTEYKDGFWSSNDAHDPYGEQYNVFNRPFVQAPEDDNDVDPLEQPELKIRGRAGRQGESIPGPITETSAMDSYVRALDELQISPLPVPAMAHNLAGEYSPPKPTPLMEQRVTLSPPSPVYTPWNPATIASSKRRRTPEDSSIMEPSAKRPRLIDEVLTKLRGSPRQLRSPPLKRRGAVHVRHGRPDKSLQYVMPLLTTPPHTQGPLAGVCGPFLSESVTGGTNYPFSFQPPTLRPGVDSFLDLDSDSPPSDIMLESAGPDNTTNGASHLPPLDLGPPAMSKDDSDPSDSWAQLLQPSPPRTPTVSPLSYTVADEGAEWQYGANTPYYADDEDMPDSPPSPEYCPFSPQCPHSDDEAEAEREAVEQGIYPLEQVEVIGTGNSGPEIGWAEKESVVTMKAEGMEDATELFYRVHAGYGVGMDVDDGEDMVL